MNIIVYGGDSNMPSWSKDELIQHLKPPPGISMPPYPAARDRFYRWTLAFSAVGLIGEGIATLFAAPRIMDLFQGWISVSFLLAGWTFLVWLTSWRSVVRGLAAAGLVVWPFWSLGGWALTLSSSAIMAAKETHCFHFWAGRIIPWMSLAFGFSMIATSNRWVIGIGWLMLGFLWTNLVLGRWRLPLFEI